MARYGRQRRAKRKRREREHEQWFKEQSEDTLDPRGGEFVVLVWPGPTKSEPMNYYKAMALWKESEKAMVFRKNDFFCKQSNG